jgi:hypothetical protein
MNFSQIGNDRFGARNDRFGYSNDRLGASIESSYREANVDTWYGNITNI